MTQRFGIQLNKALLKEPVTLRGERIFHIRNFLLCWILHFQKSPTEHLDADLPEYDQMVFPRQAILNSANPFTRICETLWDKVGILEGNAISTELMKIPFPEFSIPLPKRVGLFKFRLRTAGNQKSQKIEDAFTVIAYESGKIPGCYPRFILGVSGIFDKLRFNLSPLESEDSFAETL